MLLRAVTLALALLMGRSAWSQTCPIPIGSADALSQIPPDARLAFLRDVLRHEGGAASAWRWTWTAVYSAGTAAQFAITPALPPEDRPVLYIDGAATALAIVPLQVVPLKIAHDGPAFDARIQAAGPMDICTLVHEGEEILARDALDEKALAGWEPQVAYAGYGVLVAIVVGAVTRNWLPALVSGIGAIILGEGQILTQPIHLPSAWNSYRSGDISTTSPSTASVGPIPTGLGIGGAF